LDDAWRLYAELIECWNRRDAMGFADLFAEEGGLVGFDGSQVDGRAAIEDHLAGIFADHRPQPYVSIVREVRALTPDVAIVRAVAGMGERDINPAVNAIQTLIVARRDGRWEVQLFQTTPAAFHGRPDASAELTAELRDALKTKSAG
jgi:uncharacterized protein (TIGR02246 family)